MDDKPNIAILILAAGESSRMGDHIKQILPWRSTNLLGFAVEQANASIANATYVVLGAHQETIMAEVPLGATQIIQNANWSDGLGSSIACGINFILSRPIMPDAVLIMLADQPLIDTNYLNKMVGNWIGNRSRIITTQYEKGSGVPAIFGKKYFSELQGLDQDHGAKDLIALHSDAILAINPEGKQIDVDTWETYQDLIRPKKK